MSLNEFVRIDGEIKNSQLTKLILGKFDSWFTVDKVEETIHERQRKVQNEVQQLKANLENTNLTEEARCKLENQLKILEGSTVCEYLLLSSAAFINDLDHIKSSETEPDQYDSYFKTCESFNDWSSLVTSAKPDSTWLFVGEYAEDDIQWRAVPFGVCNNSRLIDNFPIILPQSKRPDDQCPRGIDKDSVSHFQNCPIPPGLVLTISKASTPIEPYHLLTNGCLVSITLNNNRSQSGGITWKKSKKLLKESGKPHVTPHLKYRGNLKSYLTHSLNFLMNTKNSWRKLYPPSLASRHPSSVIIMDKPSVNFPFSLYSSEYSRTRKNSTINDGDID